MKNLKEFFTETETGVGILGIISVLAGIIAK